jgi:hypothetical protein
MLRHSASSRSAQMSRQPVDGDFIGCRRASAGKLWQHRRHELTRSGEVGCGTAPHFASVERHFHDGDLRIWVTSTM